MIDIDLNDFSVEYLQQLRYKFAKRANQRMRRLEKAERDKFAYKVVNRYLKRINRKRFSESKKVNMNITQIKRELRELIYFLNAPTSTITGQKKLEGHILNKFREKYTVISPEDFFTFLSSATFKHLSKSESSDFLIEFYDKASDDGVTHEKIMESLKKFESGKIKTIDKLYEEYGLTLIE